METKQNNRLHIFDLHGTPVTIDDATLVWTGIIFGAAILLFAVNAPYLGCAVLLTSVFMYFHEFSHYLTARDHKLPVKEIRFLHNKNEIVIGGLQSHIDIRDIALTGELSTGIYIALMTTFFLLNANGILYLQIIPFVFPLAWVLSWTCKDSDMHRAINAEEYYKVQAGIE
jgi:hypothetical protein